MGAQPAAVPEPGGDNGVGLSSGAGCGASGPAGGEFFRSQAGRFQAADKAAAFDPELLAQVSRVRLGRELPSERYAAQPCVKDIEGRIGRAVSGRCTERPVLPAAPKDLHALPLRFRTSESAMMGSARATISS